MPHFLLSFHLVTEACCQMTEWTTEQLGKEIIEIKHINTDLPVDRKRWRKLSYFFIHFGLVIRWSGSFLVFSSGVDLF